MPNGFILTAAFIFLVMQPQTAVAHKVSLFAYHEKGTVHTEAYFVDGTPCRNAKIKVTNSDGVIVAEGVSDEEGLYSFPYALAGELTISLRASMGHASEILLAVKGPDGGKDPPAGEETVEPDPDITLASEGDDSLDMAAIERIVEDRIGPIRESVKEIQKNQGKPTLGKILGGLGWIVGLAGAYLWGVTRGRR